MDLLFEKLAESLTEQHLIDITLTYFLCIILILLDTTVRMYVEIWNYNEFTKRGHGFVPLVTGFFLAWRPIEVRDGHYKRFLVSKNLREGLYSKMLFYPCCLTLSAIIMLAPDFSIPMLNVNVDVLTAHILMYIPVFQESVSIIESWQQTNNKIFKINNDSIKYFIKIITGRG